MAKCVNKIKYKKFTIKEYKSNSGQPNFFRVCWFIFRLDPVPTLKSAKTIVDLIHLRAKARKDAKKHVKAL